jgi:hypothetical protein
MNGGTIVLIIVIIIVIYFIIAYLAQDKSNLSNTILSGQVMTTIPASNLGNSSAINPSNFAYSVWFNINDWNYQYGQYKVLFGRMGKQSATPGSGSGTFGLSGADPCPVVVFDQIENDAIISIACYPSGSTSGSKTQVTTCRVSNIPLQEWVNLLISVYGKTLDVYVNGKLVKTCLLAGTAVVNQSSPVYLTPLGGFAGWTSRFQYWSNAVNPQFAWNIYEKGYTKNSIFGSAAQYQLQFSLLNNGQVKNSITM